MPIPFRFFTIQSLNINILKKVFILTKTIKAQKVTHSNNAKLKLEQRKNTYREISYKSILQKKKCIKRNQQNTIS